MSTILAPLIHVIGSMILSISLLFYIGRFIHNQEVATNAALVSCAFLSVND